VRRLKISELEWVCNHELYDPKKAPPEADAVGHDNVLAFLEWRRNASAAELIAHYRNKP